MATVRLDKVRKVYGKDTLAVNNVNLEIKDKEFVILVGPSGCGKSTILRMVAGLEDITDGEIFIDDRLVNPVPPKDRDIAMVFQNYALYPHMTVFGNMAFGLKLRKIPKEEIERRVIEASKILGIYDLLERKPKALSGGQRQRVAVGRAIVRNPKVFLFDEPLSNLDAKLRVQMRTEISKLHQKLNTTMIYVTHDQVEAMTMGDRIVILKEGTVQQIDTPLNIYKYPKNKFVAGFIGSPPMNFMLGRIIRDNGLWFDEGKIRLGLANKFERALEKFMNKDIILGIRPEDIYDSTNAGTIKDRSNVPLRAEVVEPMGNEVYLYAAAGGHSVIARLSAEFQAELGETIDVVFDMSKVHLFDVHTEEIIDLRGFMK